MYVSTGKKYPYFPEYEIKMRLTPFRSCQVEYPELYKNYKGEGFIVRVDCLWAVNDYLPITPESRNRTYLLVSGDCCDKEMQQLLTRAYRTCPMFQNHVDEIFLIRPEKILTGVIQPMRDLITEYSNRVISTILNEGGKYLFMSHDYVYCRVKTLPDLLGTEVINK